MSEIKNKTALLVDDDPRNLFAMSSYLEALDMQVETAQNGQEAIDLLKIGKHIDIILLDIMMPVMDGFETMDILKQDDAYKKIPIIAVTAKAMKGDRERCIEAGAWDYMAKPVDMRLLVDKIARWTE